MIELMIGQNDGLDSDGNHVIRLVNPMHVYVLNLPISTVNQPSIIVVDVVWLLPNDAVTIMIGIILQQMNLMNTRRQMDEPQVAHSSHEDCLDDNRITFQ
jgi:hypothetical protein